MKWFKRGLMGLAALLVSALAVAVWWWMRGLPQLDGELAVPGLRAEVSVNRDASDVTHIAAAHPLDAWRALGFVHAQERGWQLEFNRRLLRGELSEILGQSTLELDKLMRTLGILRAAQAQLERLTPQTQAALKAYSEGIVAAHAVGAAGRSPEFLMLNTHAGGEQGVAWSPVDSVGWSLMMALDLGGNWGNEVARLALSRRFTTEQLWAVMPPYPGDAPASRVDFAARYRAWGVYASEPGLPKTDVSKQADDMPNGSVAQWAQAWVRDVGVMDGKGSNNWVIPGKGSRSGHPLLANDPHLALSAPAIWYMARLRAPAAEGWPALDAMGATLPGLPFVVLGRTRGVAWGFTNTGPDVQDLYLEALSPDRPGQYQTPTGWQAFESRQEVIRVKNQPDVRFTARATRHGPVISDVQALLSELIDSQRHVVSLRWAALDADNLSLEAGRLANQAQTVTDLIAAFASHHSPMQSVVMADTQGQVAFQAVGRVPVRSPQNDFQGVAPAPGWLAAYDWTGWIPYANNPALNATAIEAQGWYATANQKITPEGYAHWLTGDWTTPERMQRITQRLGEWTLHDSSTMQAIQNDVRSLGAQALLPHALRAQPLHPLGPSVMAILRVFDGHMTRESAAAAVFNVWSDEITRGLFSDKVGEKVFAALYGKRHFRAGLLQVLNQPDAFWCPAADCTPLISQAMDRAIGRLVEGQGSDPGAWRWGEWHRAISSHKPFAQVGPLARWFNISTPSGGDLFTVNVGQYWANDKQEPFANRHAASLRAIYDLSPQGTNRFIYQTGQSGQVGASRSQDMVNEWASGRYRELTFDPPSWTNRLQLKPDGI